jgi:hypothetical protein
VLAEGVEEGEEPELNDALTGVLGAYGLVAATSSETTWRSPWLQVDQRVEAGSADDAHRNRGEQQRGGMKG